MPDGLERLLLGYEHRLLDPDVRHDPAAVGSLLAQDFREFGSSGRIFDRDAILDLLHSEPASDQPIAVLSDFSLSLLGADAALVTYKATTAGRTTLRSSLWVYREGRWLLLFHQGTPTRG